MVNRRRPHIRTTWLVPTLLGSVVVVFVSAGAVAALDTNTVTSYWRGVWWSVSLITTVGFIGEPPETVAGAALSAALMILGFLLLAMVSATLAAVLVRDVEEPRETREEAVDQAITAALQALHERLDAIEALLAVTSPTAGDAQAGTGGPAWPHRATEEEPHE